MLVKQIIVIKDQRNDLQKLRDKLHYLSWVIILTKKDKTNIPKSLILKHES